MKKENVTEKPVRKRRMSKKAEQTREKIWRAAFELFSREGFDHVTVEDITKHAGVSKGLFYTYFPEKEAVLTEHFRQVDGMYEKAYRELPKEMSTMDKMLRLVDTMCAFCQDECGLDFLRVIYAHQLLHPYPDISILNHPEREIVPILTEIAKTGKERGEVPDFIDVDIFAREVAHLAHGVIYDWCMDGGVYDLREEGHRVFEEVLKMSEHYGKKG